MPYEQCGRGQDGYDCWGFFRLLYRVYFEIELPAYDGIETNAELDEIDQILAGGESGWTPVTRPRFGDGLLFRLPGNVGHIGFWVDRGTMLHIHRGINSCRMRYNGLVRPYRLRAIYRHPSLSDS